MDRSTLKHIPAGRTLKLSGNLTLDGNAVIDLIDTSGRVFEIDSEIHSVEGVPSRILIRQAPKRRRFSTPRDGEGKFSDSIVRVLKANNDFHDAWQVDGGILEAAAPDALGRAALVIASNGRLDLGGHDHALLAATINGEELKPGLHTFKALKARFPKHILGEGGSLTISQ